jgi:hypothetical protein
VLCSETSESCRSLINFLTFSFFKFKSADFPLVLVCYFTETDSTVGFDDIGEIFTFFVCES